MNRRQQFFLCHNGERWVPFAAELLSEVDAKRLTDILNDQMSEQGISVRVIAENDDDLDGFLEAGKEFGLEEDFAEIMRQESATVTDEERAESRKVRRELAAWERIVADFETGEDDDIPIDYPQQYQAWCAFPESVEYLRSLVIDGETDPSPSLVIKDQEPKPLPAVIESQNPSDLKAINSKKPRRRQGDGWSHDGDPSEGSKYRFGPVSGPISAIAEAVAVEERTLKKWNGKSIWIRRIHSRLYTVYFDSDRLYQMALAGLPDDAISSVQPGLDSAESA